MTVALITVDTELSALLHQQGVDAAGNVARSITGKTMAGDFGIGWQMDQLDRHGLKGVYFVDPMPALVFGEAVVSEMVAPILARGHEVQLHIHTGWLEWAKNPPVATRGTSIADFNRVDQEVLLGLALDLLERAGAPRPSAFRAGNFGANDDTLSVLAGLGLVWDSSFNGYYAGGLCRIGLDPAAVDPLPAQGLTEIPVAMIHDRPRSVRPVQVCALSAGEMRAGLYHAAATRRPAFAIATHSFEMLSRDRKRPNRQVMARFSAMCRAIAEHPDLETRGFHDLALAAPTTPQARLAPNRLRTLGRQVEQAWGTWAYERRLRPL